MSGHSKYSASVNGVEEWQRKLQTSFGMGNDDIMRQILPEEIIREKGLKALGEEKEAIYREVYAPEIRPVRGLWTCSKSCVAEASPAPSVRRAAAKTSISSSATAVSPTTSPASQRRPGDPLQARPGNIPAGSRRTAPAFGRMPCIRGCPGRHHCCRRAGAGRIVPWQRLYPVIRSQPKRKPMSSSTISPR